MAVRLVPSAHVAAERWGWVQGAVPEPVQHPVHRHPSSDHRTAGRAPHARRQHPGRRVPGLALPPVFTNSTEPTVDADLTHRWHAICETVWSDLIDGPWAHQPSGRFPANAAFATVDWAKALEWLKSRTSADLAPEQEQAVRLVWVSVRFSGFGDGQPVVRIRS
jgi:hypothetical protein